MVTVLSVATRAVVEACEGLGLDGDALLEEAGLCRSEVFDPDARLPAERSDRVWVAAAALSGDVHLALHAAERLPDGAYRVLDFVVASSPTIGASLERIARYFPVIDPRAQFRVRANDQETRLEFRAPGSQGLPPPAQLYSFAAIVTRLRRFSGTQILVKRVEFDFPALEDLGECTRIFTAELKFEAKVPALVFSDETVRRSLPTANPDLLAVLDAHAERLLADVVLPDASLEEQLRGTLRDELRGGDISAGHLGKRLGVSERTLQRRLAELNTSFAEILSGERRRLAEEYLKSPQISVTEIAWLLGFSEQSAFSRAFKRWTGASPAAYRKGVLAGG